MNLGEEWINTVKILTELENVKKNQTELKNIITNKNTLEGINSRIDETGICQQTGRQSSRNHQS